MVSTHLKNISQIGNLPQIGVKIKNVWNHHLEDVWSKRKDQKTSRWCGNKFLLMLIGWFLSIISCFPVQSITSKKWLQKLVKKKKSSKKNTSPLVDPRGSLYPASSATFFAPCEGLFVNKSPRVSISDIWSHVLLASLCYTCGKSDLSELEKKTIKIIEYNLSHEKFVTRVESVFWMSEWKQNPFPTRKKLWMDLPLSKMVHINHPESWIILSFLVLYEPLVN